MKVKSILATILGISMLSVSCFSSVYAATTNTEGLATWEDRTWASTMKGKDEVVLSKWIKKNDTSSMYIKSSCRAQGNGKGCSGLLEIKTKYKIFKVQKSSSAPNDMTVDKNGNNSTVGTNVKTSYGDNRWNDNSRTRTIKDTNSYFIWSYAKEKCTDYSKNSHNGTFVPYVTFEVKNPDDATSCGKGVSISYSGDSRPQSGTITLQ